MRTKIALLAVLVTIVGVIACEPQSNTNNIPEQDNGIEKNEQSPVTDNPYNEQQSPELNEDSTEPKEPSTGGEAATGPDMPLILQAKDVWVGAHPANYGINVSASEIEYSHFGIEFGFTGSSEEESDDLYTSWTEFAVISKWCDENVEIVNSMVETFKNEDVEIYHKQSTYAYCTIVDIEITADKPLWGVEVGQNLVDKFYLHSVRSPLLFSYPECKYMGNIFEMEKPWYKIFENCLWPQKIVIRPIEPVESIYDVVTFRIKLHSPDYVIDFEGGGPVTFVPDGYFENLINTFN